MWQEELQVIQVADHRHAPQPPVIQRLDDAFGHRDRPVLPRRARSLLDIPLSRWCCYHVVGEDTLLFTDDVLRRSMLRECILRNSHHATCVRRLYGQLAATFRGK